MCFEKNLVALFYTSANYRLQYAFYFNLILFSNVIIFLKSFLRKFTLQKVSKT